MYGHLAARGTMFIQMGFDVTSKKQINAYGAQGFVTVEGKTVTLREKIASFKASIAWAEEQLALTRSWENDNGYAFARPNDWIVLMDELEADLLALTEATRVAA
jgi:hypothetical protein